MISCYFGLPGVGKSSLLAKIASSELKRIAKGKSKYKYVYSNYYIKGCYMLKFEQLGQLDFSDSLILLDELTLEADSRDFKKFALSTKMFFILHRHYNCDIVYATQQYDGIDKKIRDLTSNLYYMRKLGSFTYSVPIYRHITINESSEIVYGYQFPHPLEYIFRPTLCQIFYRPFVYKYFDSFEAPKLGEHEPIPW